MKLYLRPEQIIWNFWPSLIWPKYLNPGQQTGTLCHKMKSPYLTMCFLIEKSFSKILFVSYLKMQNKNNNEKVSRNYPPYYSKKTYFPILWLIFLHNGQYQCSHNHTRDLINHNTSLLLLAIVIVINSLKLLNLEVLSEVNILPWI